MIASETAKKSLHTYRNPSTFTKVFIFTCASSKSSAMGELDSTFIQEPKHRPKLALTEAQGIPQIDLSPLINSSPTDYMLHQY
ncbi:hypothetical protein Tco_0647782 [Tanacetum coccineum]